MEIIELLFFWMSYFHFDTMQGNIFPESTFFHKKFSIIVWVIMSNHFVNNFKLGQSLKSTVKMVWQTVFTLQWFWNSGDHQINMVYYRNKNEKHIFKSKDRRICFICTSKLKNGFFVDQLMMKDSFSSFIVLHNSLNVSIL